MSTVTLELPELYPQQQAIRDSPERFKAVCLGRRAGKTFMGCDMVIDGSGAYPGAIVGLPIAWFSPTYKMLSEVWRDVRRLLAPITSRSDSQEHRIELITGGIVDMWSLENPDAARGRKYAGAVIDEAAMVTCMEEAWQAVIRPTLTDFSGWAVFCSTPRGMGYFKTLWDKGNDTNESDWGAWQLPTAVNPYIPVSEIEAARRDMTERRFQQEYMAQFLEGEGYVFRNVQECSTAEKCEPYPGTFVAGVDFGRSNDYTAVCVVDAATKREVALDRFNGPDWGIQRARILATLDRWNVTTALLESNSFGSPNIEELRKLRPGIMQEFATTAATKRAFVENMVLELENKGCRLLAPGEVEHAAAGQAELLAYESTELPSGTIRYSAPEGQHDDTVIARCLAYWACRPRQERFLV